MSATTTTFAQDIDRYGVIGHPISHSRSPFIHGEFAAATGQRLVYERFDVPPESLTHFIPEFFAGGGRGLNVTVPHKEAALQLADLLTERARLAGAVNTLAKQDDGQLVGDNTDGAGLLKDLAALSIAIKDRRVLILGAGGATRGILAPLLDAAAASITIANRTLARAQQLLAEFSQHRPDATNRLRLAAYEDLHEPFDLIVHATSLGLSGALPKIDACVVSPTSDAYDLGYGADLTPFLLWARQHGACSSHDGLGMLVEQAAESFALWRGVRPNTDEVRRKLRATLDLKS